MTTKDLPAFELVFPEASSNFSKTLRQVKRSELSISNRLRSIREDSKFIQILAEQYNLPLIANERCGSWYIPPDLKADSAYFKSTDGHFGQWSFSLRRLNLHLLDVIGRHDGCIIVDSTRKGKYSPDALSKTVPIWCAVLNRLLFCSAACHILEINSAIVSASERSQIEHRLDGFVEKVKTLNLDISKIRKTITKPLQPILLSQKSLESSFEDSVRPPTSAYHRLYLAVASKYCDDASEERFRGYIQGAGDDSEGWARNLKPEIFWSHHEQLLATPEADLPDLIDSLDRRHRSQSASPSTSVLISPTPNLNIGQLNLVEIRNLRVCALIICAHEADISWSEEADVSFLHLKCRSGKLGSRDLRKELIKVPSFIEKFGREKKIIICCPSGKDISVGVALAILSQFTNEKGSFCPSPAVWDIDKTLIRQKLSWITTSLPSARPSRSTLNAVNSFLIKHRS